jgi:hypothetical protein
VDRCTPCPKGTFSDKYGSKHCSVCAYPSYTTLPGQKECDGFNLLFGFGELAGFLAALFSIFLITVAQAGEKKKAAVVLFLLPTIDVLTDISYWTTTGFFRPYMFILSLLCFLLPNSVFLYKIYQLKVMPYILKIFPGFLYMGKTKLVWLSAIGGRPAVNGELLSVTLGGTRYPLPFANHDSIVKAGLYVLSWILIIIMQHLFWIAFALWLALSVFYLGPLAILGIYLFQCKVISVGPVW